MNLALDMMGGDFAPLEAVKGLQLYLQNNRDATVYCIGDEQQIQSILTEYKVPQDKLVIVHTTEIIGYNEHPTKAFKDKPDSSIAKGFQLLASGKVDAFLLLL